MHASVVRVRGHAPPPRLAAALDDDAPLVVVRTPRRDLADTGLSRTLAGRIFRAGLSARSRWTAVWLTPFPGVVRSWIDELIVQGIDAEISARLVRLGPAGRLHIESAHRPFAAATDQADLVVVDHAEQCEGGVWDAAQAYARHAAGRVVAIGALGAESHWFERLAGSRHTLTYEDAIDVHTVTGGRLGISRERAKALRPGKGQGRLGEGEWMQAMETTRPPKRDDAKLPTVVFARQRLHIRDLESPRIIPFVPNAFQVRYIEGKARGRAAGHRIFIVLKARRGGISTMRQAEQYQLNSTTPSTRSLTFAQTEADTQAIFNIARIFRDNDPLRPPLPANPAGHRIDFPTLGSSYMTRTATPNGVGRGDIFDLIHGSEVAFWMPGRKPALIEQMLAGLTQAARDGEIVLESTANGHNHFHKMWEAAQRGESSYYPIFLPWFIDARNALPLQGDDATMLRDTLAEAERGFLERLAREELDARDILDDDELLLAEGLPRLKWRRAKQLELGALFPQEYPETPDEAFLSTGTPFFDLDVVRARLAQIEGVAGLREVVAGVAVEWARRVVAVPGGQIVRWEEPSASESYIIGADNSEGIQGGDYAGYTVIEADTGREVEAGHGLFKPEQLGDLIADAHDRWRRATLGVELDGYGYAVVQRLLERRISTHAFYCHTEGKPGWRTTEGTRNLALNALDRTIRETPEAIRDVTLLRECLTFKLQKSGKFEADSNAHDDAVMKRAIAAAVRQLRPPRPGGGWGRPKN